MAWLEGFEGHVNACSACIRNGLTSDLGPDLSGPVAGTCTFCGIAGEIPACWKCGDVAHYFMDGPYAGPTRRALCKPCEYRDWRATAAAMSAAPQG